MAESLYCQEEQWEEDDSACFNHGNTPNLLVLKDHDLFWEHDELSTMLSKEEENRLFQALLNEPNLALARREALDWMLKVNAHFSFSLQTAVLAVNYLDRFLCGFKFQTEKPWLAQLTALACLSLAAKIEETYVPLLSDLQVQTKYLFEAKTIQRMELLVLSTLEWKMNPVTPYSFLDYMTRRLGLKDHLCLEFLGRCKMVLLATISDSRFMCYLPSVVAASTLLHVVSSLDPCIVEEYQSQILAILGISKEIVNKCGKLILELQLGGKILLPSNKRKLISIPGSPNGVIDASLGSDNSNESWAVASIWSASSSEPMTKKMRVDQERQLERLNHPSVNSLSIPP
ncbi:hypothetical protein V2J09_007143 [Rumex salicifolius]